MVLRGSVETEKESASSSRLDIVLHGPKSTGESEERMRIRGKVVMEFFHMGECGERGETRVCGRG
jgi:hypothetical protein